MRYVERVSLGRALCCPTIVLLSVVVGLGYSVAVAVFVIRETAYPDYIRPTMTINGIMNQPVMQDAYFEITTEDMQSDPQLRQFATALRTYLLKDVVIRTRYNVDVYAAGAIYARGWPYAVTNPLINVYVQQYRDHRGPEVSSHLKVPVDPYLHEWDYSGWLANSLVGGALGWVLLTTAHVIRARTVVRSARRSRDDPVAQ